MQHCVGKCKQSDERAVPPCPFPKSCRGFYVLFVSRIKRKVAAKVGTPAAPRLERLKLVHEVRGQCFVVGFLGTYGDARGKASCVMNMGLLVY